MFVNRTLTWIIFIILLLVSNYFIDKIISKKMGKEYKENESQLGIVYVVALVTILICFNLMLKTVYLVKNRNDVSSYYLIGSKNYIFADGSSKEISQSFNRCIINDYNKNLVLESINYKSKNNSFTGKYFNLPIAPFTVTFVDFGIDYFLDDTPPQTKSSKVSAEINYWLHE